MGADPGGKALIGRGARNTPVRTEDARYSANRVKIALSRGSERPMGAEPEQAFRHAMGAFATGVTVVTAARADGRMSGITVNSITSVSLQPRLLLWCLGDRSERYDVFAAADAWGVTVLGADEETLALRFARAETEGLDTHEAETFGAAPVLRAGVAHLAHPKCGTRIDANSDVFSRMEV